MSTIRKFTAVSSAAALAAGTMFMAAGTASAQGSAEIADDLALAAEALNGPVTVSGNEECGPTVSFTNETDALQRCIGFTMPYSTVETLDLDPGGLEFDDIGEGLALLAAIEAEGGTSGLTTDGSGGDPVATEGGLVGIFTGWFTGNGLQIEEGETGTWEALAPTEEPAAAVIFCDPEGNDDIANWVINFGIDPQVVADQINDRLGPLGSVEAGMISGGSVEVGADLLGSVAIS